MFTFKNDILNAIVTVTIPDGPSTMMYYPRGEEVVFGEDFFVIGDQLYYPVVEVLPRGLGRKIEIEKAKITVEDTEMIDAFARMLNA
jgi:hypothetical protein